MRQTLLASIAILAVAAVGTMAEGHPKKPSATKQAPAEQPAVNEQMATSQAAAESHNGASGKFRGAMNDVGGFFKDSWLTSKTKSKLFADKRVKGLKVSVETRHGIVTLRGKVATAAARRAAEEVTKSTKGVKSVVNVLQVVPEAHRKSVDAKDDEIEDAVKARIEAEPMLTDARISVRSDNAVVTLKGTVPDARAGSRAVDLAKGVPGVRSVRNELRPKEMARAN